MLDLLGWDTVTKAEFLAWSYLQTDDLLADLADQLAGLPLHLLADTEQDTELSPQSTSPERSQKVPTAPARSSRHVWRARTVDDEPENVVSDEPALAVRLQHEALREGLRGIVVRLKEGTHLM